jgi:hypothetical protein
LTICTFYTGDNLNQIFKLVHQYRGPISIAYYITEKNDYTALAKIWSNNFILRKYVNFHLVSKMDDKYSYLNNEVPYNTLRNVAIKYSKTKYIFSIDPNIILPKSFRSFVKNDKLE